VTHDHTGLGLPCMRKRWEPNPSPKMGEPQGRHLEAQG